MEKDGKAKAGLPLDDNESRRGVACTICTSRQKMAKMARDIPGITMKHVNFARVLATRCGIHGKPNTSEHVFMRA